MPRNLLVCGALCCLSGCIPPPGTPSLLQTPVTGNWSGTFSSSWGDVKTTASLANEQYSQTISGSFVLDGQRATGSIYGGLDTKRETESGIFHGQISISYQTSGGAMCSSSGTFSGSGSETLLVFDGPGFTTGNCPDPPTDVRITLRR
jgi:hypothetical protein